MSCIIHYKGERFTEEEFERYVAKNIINSKEVTKESTLGDFDYFEENGTQYKFLTNGWGTATEGYYAQGSGNHLTRTDWKPLKNVEKTHGRLITTFATPLPKDIEKHKETLRIIRGKVTLPNGKIITLNDQQIEALDKIDTWLSDSKGSLYFTLAGYAGTGKTTIVKEAIKNQKSVAVSAPTHKAKNVIADSVGRKAFTIQSILGLRPDLDLDDFDPNNPQFNPKADPIMQDYKILVIDEASMLNKDLFNYLIDEAKQHNTKILFMGDPAQLPPIKEEISQVFVSDKIQNKVELTKVERQAGSNPIMSIYDSIRNNITDSKDNFQHETKLNSLGEGIQFYKDINKFKEHVISFFNSDEFKKDKNYTKLLSWTNKQVGLWNNIIRKSIFGEEAKEIEKGDLLLSYITVPTSAYSTNLENSAEYEVKSVKEGTSWAGIKGYDVELVSVDTKAEIDVFIVSQEDYPKFKEEYKSRLNAALADKTKRSWPTFYGLKNTHHLLNPIVDSNGKLIGNKTLDYGYAMTVHKSQGSTYNTVFVTENVIDQNDNDKERNKLKYVAFSRPTKKVVSLSNKTTSEENTYQDEDLLPSFEEEVPKYNDIISERKERIKTIEKNIAKSSDDRARVGRLKDLKKQLEEEVAQLQDETSLTYVAEVGRKDLKEVLNILSQENISESDLEYADKVLHIVEKYTEYLFEEDELRPDNEGNYSAAVELIKSITGEADLLRARLTKVQLSSVLQLVNKINDNNYQLSDILIGKDINPFSANLLDISRNGLVLTDTLDRVMRDASFDSNREALDIFNEIDTLTDKLKNEPLFKDKGYYLFAQKDGKGKLTGNIVNPYSQKFYDAKSKLIKDAKKKGTQDAWKQFFNWKKENEIVFDVRKLFNSYYVSSGGQHYSKKDVDAHISELKNTIGEKRYEELYRLLEEKIERYKLDHESAVERYAEEQDEAVKQSLIDEWEKENSPFKYVEHVYDGVSFKKGDKYISPKGYQYTFEAPRKVDSKGNSTEWYDKDFEVIENNENLYNFYRYMIDTFNKMYSYLPESSIDKLQYNSLPSVEKSITELFNEKGLKASMNGWYDRFIDSISSVEGTQYDKPNELQAKMLGNKLEAEEKSYDMAKIMKMFTMSTLSYKHKSKVEDSVRLMQRVINNVIEEKAGVEGSKKEFRNLKQQVDYAVDVFYGNRTINQNNTLPVKVRTTEEKAEIKKINAELVELEKQFELGKISEDKYKAQEKELIAKKKAIGKNLTGSKVLDKVLKYIQVKGMGWNLPAATANVGIAYFSNLIHAMGGEDFKWKHFKRAFGIMMNSTLKSSSLNNYSNKTSNKISSLMYKYSIANNIYDYYDNSSLVDNKAKKGWKQLLPYEVQQRAEFLNQGSTFIATMLATEIQSKDGKISLWDAYDEEGNWREDLFSDEVNKEWNGNLNDPTANKKLKEFKNKTTQIVKLVHGNYDPDSSVRIKQGIAGRALMQFRSWIAEGFANRFEKEKYDSLLQRKRKGRYRSYANFYKDSDPIHGTLKLLQALVSKAGREGLSDMDAANMRKNAAELSMYISLYVLGILLKELSGDDEDDESKYIANFLVNQSFRLQTDLSFYTSPISFERLQRNALPVFSLAKDIDEFRMATLKFISGEDEIRTGQYARESRLLRETLQLLPFGTQIYRNRAAIERVQE